MSDTSTKTEPKTPGIEIIGAEDMASSRGIGAAAQWHRKRSARICMIFFKN